MSDLSTAPASDTESPAEHDAADVNDDGASSTPAPPAPPGQPGENAKPAQPDTVSSVLSRLEETGWRSLHERTAPGYRTIDAIVIGVGGIFVIDNHVLDVSGA